MAKILIAEDDDAIRELVMRALGEDGHELTGAADGAEALDVLSRHDGKYDLLPVSYTHLTLPTIYSV